MSQKKFHDYIVPGLDVLISDPTFLVPDKNTKPKAKVLYIPSFYVYRLLDFYNEQTNRGESARELTNILGYIATKMDQSKEDVFIFENGMQLKFEDFPENVVFRGCKGHSDEKYSSSKFHAIAVAKVLQERFGKDNVAIMTGSDQLATPAAFNKIDVARINPDVYTGRVKVEFPDAFANEWWTKHAIPESLWNDLFPEIKLMPNQYVELVFSDVGQIDSSYQNIGRFDGENIVPLRFRRFENPAFHRISPRTAGQAMLLDALLAPIEEIPIVIASGVFGTGKTFCTAAAALAHVMNRKYKKIFVCPRDSSLGREIGHLPGQKTDKVSPQAAPFFDALEAVIDLLDMKTAVSDAGSDSTRGRKKGDNDNSSEYSNAVVAEYRKRFIELEPVVFMGGRSIRNSFIVFDEFQDTERRQAIALLSRVGEGSKIVVLGDPYQTTNPHLNKTSNGLSYSANKLAGNPLTAVITFNQTNEVVRSAAARYIAERFAYHKAMQS